MNYYPNYNQFYPIYNQPYNKMIQPNQQQIEQAIPQYVPQGTIQTKSIGLLGKSVDSIDVVKAMDIPLDGSVSYFPLTDGTAIVTKQLQQDGTSKTVVYKPIQEEEIKKSEKKYVTTEELTNAISGIDLSDIEDLKDELDELKKQIKELKKSKSKEV